jgi:hypothetical protein
MITIDVQGKGVVVVDHDEDLARFIQTEAIGAELPSGGTVPGQEPRRVLLEALRRFGGIAPRALIGGTFLPGGNCVRIEINVGVGVGETYPSRLWKRPLTPGLPPEFAAAVLRGFMIEDAPALPAGTLTIDRAGFDEIESAEPIFEQIASVFMAVMDAMLGDRDISAAARAAVSAWA